MRKIVNRLFRTTFFDRKALTEASFDDDAPADAAIIVAGVGLLTYLLAAVIGPGGFDAASLIQLVLAGVMAWLVLALATWFVATRLFGARSSPQTIMGLQGLASLPLILGAFDNEAVQAVGLVWYLVLLVIATREAGNLSTRNAGVSVLIGFAVAALVRMIFGAPFLFLGQIF